MVGDEKHMQREIKSVNNIFGDFLVKSGLYDEIEITEDNIFELADLIGGHVKIESYCPKCKWWKNKRTIFRRRNCILSANSKYNST